MESNPGEKQVTPDFGIISYNCNGLGDKKKLRRLLTKLKPEVEKGKIVFLQETHIVNTDYLNTLWKHKYISNCVKTNSAGVIILFDKNYDIVQQELDTEGRSIVAVIESQDSKLIVANSYFYNNHSLGIGFAETLYTKILTIQNNFPDFVTISAGDFNTCISTNDCLNRLRDSKEVLLAEIIVRNNNIAELKNAYRSKHSKEGFTWRRGHTYSRLDYIYITKSLTSKITTATTNWALDKSDHAAVEIDFKLKDDIVRGPGIPTVNIKVLEDPEIATQVGLEIQKMFEQAPTCWNPHDKLESLKVSIRTVIATKVAKVRNELREEIVEKENAINQIEKLRIKATTNSNINSEEKQLRLTSCDIAKIKLTEQLSNLRTKLDENLTFVAKAKWFEFGEKSNKFFLNLNKCRQNRKNITEINDNDKHFIGQKQVTEGISSFYRNLYKKVDTKEQDDDNNFYSNCPKLNNEQTEIMDKKLSLNDLKEALLTCSDTSPGPDGIPYSIYKRYWSFMGPILLESWTYSMNSNSLPASHRESIITLLPKEGKDTSDIKNWRPITLSNCDAKIITKALSNKISKVLEDIIHLSQTAYVPGRSVSDNLRSNFYYKQYCKNQNKDTILVSLDAKKAFDSVNHDYIEKTLRAYGFGNEFIKVFRLLYRDLTARILVNGYMSNAINIERGVKQGDALSCAIRIHNLYRPTPEKY